MNKVWVLSILREEADWYEVHKVYFSLEELEKYLDEAHEAAEEAGEFVSFSYQSVDVGDSI